MNADEGTDGDFLMEPVIDFYEYEMHKDEPVDLMGGEDIDVLVEQLDEEEIVLEEELKVKPSLQLRSFAPKLAPAPGLTMGFLQPLGSDNATSYVYDSATSNYASTYISASVSYTGVIPFVEYKNGRYRIVVSGVEGWVNEANFRPYAANTKDLKVNHYTPNDSGNLGHWISRAAVNSTGGISYDGIGNGTTPSYLKTGVDYFSGDGHYFYKDTITMLNDYKNNTRKNSVNPNTPYYNYFQFISYRTKTNITVADLDKYITNTKGYTSAPTNWDTITSNQSKLYDAPKHFINIGHKYGGNPLMTMSLAINESGWGRSYISVTKNNLFGHAAYDSSPGSATGYESVADSIAYHNQYYINNLYSNTNNPIYHGAYFGNKAGGMNVKYASDPHWGEKAADHYTALNRNTGNKDTNSTTIGIVKTGSPALNTRKEPNTTSAIMYVLEVDNQAVNILGSVKGTTVNGSDVWYKISSDALLDSNRNVVKATSGTAISTTYDYDKNYVYVHSSYIDIVAGKGVTEEKPTILVGDATGDGKITIQDVIRTHKYYKGLEKIPTSILPNIDFNNNGKITLQTVIKVHKIFKGIN